MDPRTQHDPAQDLARRAEIAERTGRSGEASQMWAALVGQFPNHPRALFVQGRARVEQGDPDGALAFLTRAEAGEPTHSETPLYVALAYRMKGEFTTALAAIDRALAADPYFFLALLSKGSLLERLGKVRAAAEVYRNAIKIAPTLERMPPSQRAAYEHAQKMVADNAAALAAHLRARTANVRARFKDKPLDRFDESLNILAGVQKRYVHDPILLYYPKLPAYTFYDRAYFPWLEKLEAATEMIKSELAVVLREDWNKFSPYIQLPPEAPVNQWVQLNHSELWSTFFLWKDGARQDENCARCPKTAALLDELPLAHQTGYSPTVVFSVLAPHTRIPPHTGSTNTRLLTHLPLILPPKCGFRVGNDVREWRMGEAWVFDDSVEHEAWNESDETRVIMIFDVWNPLLSEAERDLVTEMMNALNEFKQGE